MIEWEKLLSKKDPSMLQPPDFELPQLKFEVDTFFTIGSPVSMFLVTRGLDNPTRLPKCKYMVFILIFRDDCSQYNIYHPYDPVVFFS
jgi:hypothetical protein